MAIIQALLAAVSRQLGRLLNTAFGWAATLVFGRVPQDRQLFLSALSGAALLWLVVAIGVAFPSAGTFLLAFVPIPKWVDVGLVRLLMLALAVLLPAIVGVASLFLKDPDDRRKGLAAKLKTVAKGYSFTIGLSATFVLMMIAAPILKMKDILRRWTSTHIPIVIEPGDYSEVVSQIRRVLRDNGRRTRRVAATWLLRFPTKVLTWLAGAQVQSLIAEKLAVLRGENFEVMVHPSDLVISGPEAQTMRVHAIVTEHLTLTKAYLTWTKEGHQIEDRIEWLFHEVHSGAMDQSSALAGIKQIEQGLSRVPVSYEEWEILFREALLLERDFLSRAPTSSRWTSKFRDRAEKALEQSKALRTATMAAAALSASAMIKNWLGGSFHGVNH